MNALSMGKMDVNMVVKSQNTNEFHWNAMCIIIILNIP